MLTERLLDPKSVDIRAQDDHIVLIAHNTEAPIEQIVRCFPFSTPDHWISLRNPDGVELGLIDTLEGLSEQAQQLIRSRLDDRYAMPIIQRIQRVESGPQGAIWHVDTDEGVATVTVRGDRGLDITGFPRILFTDAQTRKRFILPDFTTLDRPSQKLARAHLPMGFRGRHGRHGRF